MNRAQALPSEVLRSEEDIDAYLAKVKGRLLEALDDDEADGIRLG